MKNLSIICFGLLLNAAILNACENKRPEIDNASLRASAKNNCVQEVNQDVNNTVSQDRLSKDDLKNAIRDALCEFVNIELAKAKDAGLIEDPGNVSEQVLLGGVAVLGVGGGLISGILLAHWYGR